MPEPQNVQNVQSLQDPQGISRPQQAQGTQDRQGTSCSQQAQNPQDPVQSAFNAKAMTYDQNRRLLIPDFDEFYSVGVDALACTKPSPQVLDLGGGTGLSTDFLLKRYPQARVTILDFADEMLGIARERFKNNPNIDFVVGDYRSYSPTRCFDIIISGLSIHHLSLEEKRALAKKVQAMLTPTGEFFNADVVRCQDEQLQRALRLRYEAFLCTNLDEQAMQRFRESERLDRPETLQTQLQMLLDSGFKVVDCLYRRWGMAVFYGRK